MSDIDEQHLAELLSALPPAPEAWVQAAVHLPRARAQLESRVAEVLARAEADRRVREALVADPQAALTDLGIEPSEPLVAELRARLGPEA
jgi:hypothetical protein